MLISITVTIIVFTVTIIVTVNKEFDIVQRRIIMKIGIIGASGKAGKKIVEEATARGLEVTAIVRDAYKNFRIITCD